MVKYRLDDLGWYQFEWLCQSILKSIFSLEIESWGGHSDLGRDAYFEGSLPFPKGPKLSKGPYVFQCKFVAEANAPGAKPAAPLKNAVNAEMKAIRKRFAQRKMSSARHYVLLTNVPLTAKMRTELKKLIVKEVPSCKATVMGGQDIERLLDNAPSIRVAFPQILGIADLQHLLSSVVLKPVLDRSTLVRDQAAELAQVFAPTEAYNAALKVLAKHRFVVLTGPPEVGKTTIARIIGLAKMGDGWECYECHTPEQILNVHDPARKQVFLADDAFGRTEFKPTLAQQWEQDIPFVLRHLDAKHWLIWTSRAVIFHLALQRMDLQQVSDDFPEPSEVIVDAEELKPPERALILYRHCKAAKLTKQQKLLVRKWGHSIIGSSHFTPERLRRFVVKRLPIASAAIDAGADERKEMSAAIATEIEEPTDGMRKSFANLSPEHKALLISLLDVGLDPAPSTGVAIAYQRHVPADGRQPESVVADLASHFVRQVQRNLWNEIRRSGKRPR